MNFRASPDVRRDRQPSARQSGTLFHAEQSQAGAADGIVTQLPDIKALPIILYAQMHVLLLAGEANLNLLCLRMPDDIRQCFLSDAKTLSLNNRIKPAFKIVATEVKVHASQLAFFSHEPAKSGFE